VEWYWQGTADILGINPLPLCATYLTKSGLGSQPVLRGKRSKANCLNELTNNTSYKTGGRTSGHNEANSRFSQLCECAYIVPVIAY
jgi:hypothetical protein